MSVPVTAAAGASAHCARAAGPPLRLELSHQLNAQPQFNNLSLLQHVKAVLRQVRLRAAPELQARISAWAAERGLEVPAAPAAPPGAVPADALLGAAAAPGSRLAARVRALLAEVQRFFSEAPQLYPALAEENWAQRR